MISAFGKIFSYAIFVAGMKMKSTRKRVIALAQQKSITKTGRETGFYFLAKA